MPTSPFVRRGPGRPWSPSTLTISGESLRSCSWWSSDTPSTDKPDCRRPVSWDGHSDLSPLPIARSEIGLKRLTCLKLLRYGLRGRVTRDSSSHFQAARPCRGKRGVERDLRLKLKYTSCGGPFEPHQPQVSLEKLGHATGRHVGTAIALGSRAGGS